MHTKEEEKVGLGQTSFQYMRELFLWNKVHIYISFSSNLINLLGNRTLKGQFPLLLNLYECKYLL